MKIQINGQEIAKYPIGFQVVILDLDDAEATVRTADGTLTRDRIAVKRQIEMVWNTLTWDELSTILQAMSGVFFDLYYPDPMSGIHETKTFYVGNRSSPVAFQSNGVLLWENLQLTLVER